MNVRTSFVFVMWIIIIFLINIYYVSLRPIWIHVLFYSHIAPIFTVFWCLDITVFLNFRTKIHQGPKLNLRGHETIKLRKTDISVTWKCICVCLFDWTFIIILLLRIILQNDIFTLLSLTTFIKGTERHILHFWPLLM